MSSACPSATVIGVRSSCEASWMKRRSRSSSRKFDSETRRISSTVASRLRACHTMAKNIDAMSGTSVISSSGWEWLAMSMPMNRDVANMTAASVASVELIFQTRNPYRIVTLTQMKWKGTVSHDGKRTIATRFATANRPHAMSIQYWRSGQSLPSVDIEAVPLSPNGLDEVGAELRPQTAHIDVDHVRLRIEVEAPHGSEQPLLRHGSAGVPHQLAQEQELPLRQRDGAGAEVGRAPDQVQSEAAGGDGDRRRPGDPPEARPHPCQELLEREGLGQVVLGSQLEDAHLRGRVRQR